MPIFEYRCKKCDGITEVLVRTPSDEDRVKCDDCGSAKVEKMLSAAAVAVKSDGGCPDGKCGDRMPCCAREGSASRPPCHL